MMNTLSKQPEYATVSTVSERNRANALKSTGPRTKTGKGASRLNALKHGLCANPASGVVEDGEEFERLHEELSDRFEPRDLLEVGLVHRVAVCLWRLQRSTRIDAAAGNVAVNRQPSPNMRMQRWIERIASNFWLLETVWVRNKEWIADPRSYGLHLAGERWYREERSYLKHADQERNDKISRDGAALMATVQLIHEQMDRLAGHGCLGPIEAQFLAWLLGESAERLVPTDGDGDPRVWYYPDEQPWASPIDRLIGAARKRPKGEPISEELAGVVQMRIAALRTMV